MRGQTTGKFLFPFV